MHKIILPNIPFDIKELLFYIEQTSSQRVSNSCYFFSLDFVSTHAWVNIAIPKVHLLGDKIIDLRQR